MRYICPAVGTACSTHEGRGPFTVSLVESLGEDLAEILHA